ncbi:MAG: CAP domain-containing protein [Candidatus Komeilibacteria bacterium]
MHNNRRLSTWNILKRELQSAQQVWCDYFIPHAGNNHRPHIWHRQHVNLIAAILLASKVALVIILFSFVPNGAELSPQVEQSMVDLSNQYRLQLKESTLSRNSYLDSVALLRANDMIARNYFSHYTPDGRKPWEWVDTKQYNYSRFGENLAMDFITAEAVFKAFLASPTHEKNLHNANYRDIGVATVSGVLDGKETNLMVVLFGAQQPKSAPVLADNKPAQPVTQPITVPVVKPTPIPTPKPVPVTVNEPDRIAAPQDLVTANPIIVQPTEVKGVSAETQPIPVTPTVIKNATWLQQLVSYSHDIYFLLLIAFLVIALLNILVAIRVQHRSTILASFLLIALAGYLWLVNWNGIEGWTSGIKVLGLFF